MITREYWRDPTQVIYGIVWFVVGFTIGFFVGVL